MYTIIFKTAAEKDLDAVFNWYQEQREDLGYEFLLSMYDSIRIILSNPYFAFNVTDQVRRATVSRFPYAIYYTIEEDTIYVHVIMHQFRDPEEWQKRT